MNMLKEAIARAIDAAVDEWMRSGAKNRANPMSEAVTEAALTAISEAGVRIVPEVPTEAMVIAGEQVWSDTCGTTPQAYRAMLEAAL